MLIKIKENNFIKSNLTHPAMQLQCDATTEPVLLRATHGTCSGSLIL